jgi:cobalamin biosynthesis protein CobT
MMAGSERVFKKRWETEAINSRVTVLVDMSDSMGFDGGERAALSSDVAYAIADVCERTSTQVEVIGFMNGSSGIDQTRLPDMSGGAQKVAAGWSDSTLVEFKRFDQRVREGREAIFKSRYLHRGSTPDAHALRTCVEQMGIANEQRRIVIVLTDGFGEPDKVRQVCDVAHKRGCKVLGIGILTDPEAMALAYPINACASSLSELSTVALRGLIKQVEAR